MGKSADQIYMDYQAMKAKAEKLDELAEEIRRVAENQVGDYCSGQQFWQGDSGDECCQKMTKLKNNLDKRAKDLQKTADSLRKAADRQYRLEMKLVSLVSG